MIGKVLVVDDLERALEAASGDDEVVKPIAEGVELTLKSFLDVLGKFNVEVVDPQGEPFDPNLHQAMSMVENKDVEPNTVIAVMQKGYTLNGAYPLRKEDQIGSIESGKIADFVVLKESLFDMDPYSIYKTKPRAVVMEGDIIQGGLQ